MEEKIMLCPFIVQKPIIGGYPLSDIFLSGVVEKIKTPLPVTTLLGRVYDILKSGIPCIREDTDLGKLIVWHMKTSIPRTTSAGRAYRIIKTVLDIQARVDNGETI